MDRFRLFASVLAFGSVLWGAFGLFIIISLFRSSSSYLIWSLLIFGPGYIIMVGYVIRAFCTLPTTLRRIIWAASCLVQGIWLVLSIDTVFSLMRMDQFETLCIEWWIGTLIISVYGLIADRAG